MKVFTGGTYCDTILLKPSQKRHEIEKNLVASGERPSPLDPPLVNVGLLEQGQRKH